MFPTAQIDKQLIRMSQTPNSTQDFNEWIEQNDVIPTLRENLASEHIVLYASLPAVYLYSILIPAKEYSEEELENFQSWNGCDPYSSWGVCISGDDSFWIDPPISSGFDKDIEGAEQLVFGRSLAGVKENQYELLQKFTHLSEIHYLPERNAWCKLDEHGDIQEIVKIHTIAAKGDYSGGTIITCNKQSLIEYAALTDSALLFMYDFTRYKSGNFNGFSVDESYHSLANEHISYKFGIMPGYASYLNGIQIASLFSNREEIVLARWHWDYEATPKEYATFLAWDFKKKQLAEISCTPSALSNYFTPSDLPFETSPAFFRPEVLSKYKADTEKYKLDSRSISCRGSWYLQTYDINEAGQVHTYLVYLSRLPYAEQLHWKAYNEKPKGFLSERAVTTDFKGDWYLGYDPLASLKSKLSQLIRNGVPWWKLRSTNLMDKTHYPVTTSTDEWANEIMNLDQLLVEGFDTSWLKERALELHRTPEKTAGSISLLGECLVGLGIEAEQAKKLMAPLHALHKTRSKVKGHATGSEAQALKNEAITTYGSYKKHFEELCKLCDESMETIIDTLSR